VKRNSTPIHNFQDKVSCDSTKNVDCSPSATGLKGEKLDGKIEKVCSSDGIASFLLHRARSSNLSDVTSIHHAPL
jgi:hypothetical protein